jgi:hypothetical protein
LVKGVGWATVLINFMMAMFYNTIISWAVYYLVMSLNGIRSELPWKHCNHTWNTPCCVAADAELYEYKSRLNSLQNQTSNASTNAITTTNCTRLIYSTEEFF